MYVAKKAKPFSDFPDLLKLQHIHAVKLVKATAMINRQGHLSVLFMKSSDITLPSK